MVKQRRQELSSHSFACRCVHRPQPHSLRAAIRQNEHSNFKLKDVQKGRAKSVKEVIWNDSVLAENVL